MKNLLTKIKESNEFVYKNSEYVHINEEVINKIVESFNFINNPHWLDRSPFGVLDLPINEIINFLLIYHAIGDYCLWGTTKWKIKTKEGDLDGTFAIIYLIIERMKNKKDFDLTFEEFKEFLKGEGELYLLEDRYNNLCTVNEFLKTHNKEFYDLIYNFRDDISLLDFIVRSFPFLKDESEYKGKRIYFYKRAQLLTSDILNIRKKVEGIKVDCTHLVGCADYKIPQVMRCLGILEFNEELSSLVDSGTLIPENSEMEVEIRSNDLIAINKIYEKLNKKVTRMNINDYIWTLGQDKTKITKPYHKTLTSKY